MTTPNTQHASAPAEAAKIWAQLSAEVARFARGDFGGIECVCVVRRGYSDAELLPQLEACEAMLRSPDPPATWDPKTLAVLFASISNCQTYLLSLIGAAMYFETAIESLRMNATWDYGPPNGYTFRRSTDLNAYGYWLKDRLKSITKEERAECKDRALALWPNATIGQRWTMAHTLHDPALSKEVVEQILTTPDITIARSFTCELVHDLDQATRLQEQSGADLDYETLRKNLGKESIPLLAKAIGLVVASKAVSIAHNLTKFDDPIAAAALVDCLGKQPLRPTAAAYFERGSPIGRAALEEASAKGAGTRVAQIAQDLLSRIDQKLENSSAAGANPDVVSVEEASESELPPVLASPPWQVLLKDRPVLPNPSIDFATLPVPAYPERVAVDPIAVMRAAALLSPEELAGTNEQLLAAWSNGSWYASKPAHAWVLDRLGVSAIANFDKLVYTVPELCLAIDSPRIAMLIAARVATFDYNKRSQQPCVFALRWLHRYPAAATIGLVPLLMTPPLGVATRALGIISKHADIGALIREHFGEAVLAQALPQIFAEPLPAPNEIKQASEVPLNTLARPLLLNGKKLPSKAFQHLLDMIAFSDTRFPFSGIAQVREACEPRSLAELAWDLACAWEVRLKGGGRRRSWHRRQENAKIAWLLYALVHFADEEVVRRLTPRFKNAEIIDILGEIGTDAAVLELLTIFAREKDKQDGDVRTRVNTQLDLIAAQRGMPPDELEEAVLPDPVRVGASVIDGRPVIDYGPRHFEIRWSEDLSAALVVDDAKRTAPVSKKRGGKPHLRKHLPATRKTDDPAKVARAKEVWATIVEDVAAVIARRVELLSRAMEQGRLWTIVELRRRYIDPPLLAHLTRGLLFVRDGDPPSRAFRVAEDSSFADIDDAPIAIDPNDSVRLIKSSDLSPDEVSRWRTTFFDYGLIMPIAQLPSENAPHP